MIGHRVTISCKFMVIKVWAIKVKTFEGVVTFHKASFREEEQNFLLLKVIVINLEIMISLWVIIGILHWEAIKTD